MRESLAAVVPTAGGRFERRPGYDLVSLPAIPIPELNCAWVLEREEDGRAARELAGAVAEIEAEGLPAGVLVCAGWSPRVEAEARRLGLTAEESNPGMVAFPSGLVSSSMGDLQIARVQERDLELAERVAEAGFEAPTGLLGPFYSPEVAAMPGVQIYVAHADGIPVSTAIGFTIAGMVLIYSVATPPEHRGKGYGAAVTARAVLEGFGQGADLAGLQASALGEPVYRRMGFREVLRYVVLSRPRE